VRFPCDSTAFLFYYFLTKENTKGSYLINNSQDDMPYHKATKQTTQECSRWLRDFCWWFMATNNLLLLIIMNPGVSRQRLGSQHVVHLTGWFSGFSLHCESQKTAMQSFGDNYGKCEPDFNTLFHYCTPRWTAKEAIIWPTTLPQICCRNTLWNLNVHTLKSFTTW